MPSQFCWRDAMAGAEVCAPGWLLARPSAAEATEKAARTPRIFCAMLRPSSGNGFRDDPRLETQAFPRIPGDVLDPRQCDSSSRAAGTETVPGLPPGAVSVRHPAIVPSDAAASPRAGRDELSVEQIFNREGHFRRCPQSASTREATLDSDHAQTPHHRAGLAEAASGTGASAGARARHHLPGTAPDGR